MEQTIHKSGALLFSVATTKGNLTLIIPSIINKYEDLLIAMAEVNEAIIKDKIAAETLEKKEAEEAKENAEEKNAEEKTEDIVEKIKKNKVEPISKEK